jgi:hypothetical protein
MYELNLPIFINEAHQKNGIHKIILANSFKERLNQPNGKNLHLLSLNMNLNFYGIMQAYCMKP